MCNRISLSLYRNPRQYSLSISLYISLFTPSRTRQHSRSLSNDSSLQLSLSLSLSRFIFATLSFYPTMAGNNFFDDDFVAYAQGVDGLFWKNERELCWVFWSKGEQNQLQVDFKSVLEEIPLSNYQLLVQLWVPVMDGDQKWLVCKDYPFALYGLHRGLTKYRLLSQQLKLGVSGGNEDVVGLPGRVFQYKLPESSFSIHHYSSNEWPRQDEAMECGVQSCLGLPLFDKGGVCVGVMEMTSSSKLPNLSTEQSSISQHFKAPTLTCFGIASHSATHSPNLTERNFLNQPHSEDVQQPYSEDVQKPEHEFASKKRKPSVVLTRDDMERCKGMRQVDALKFLNVSKSTFQTNLKNLKLPKWSLCKNDLSLVIGSTEQPSKGKNPAMKSSHGKKSAESVKHQKEIIIKAKVAPDDAIRFQMLYPVKFDALELTISKRMKFDVGDFLMKYEDKDAEKIRIMNDEDVQLWIETCNVLGKCEPVVFVVPNPKSIDIK